MTYLSFDRRALALLPQRPVRSNKGDFGRLLLICGSSGMAGAAYLAAKAAYRTGAGLVEIFTHKDNLVPLQTLIPEAIVTVYDQPQKELLLPSLERADAVAIGCGLGQTQSSRELLSMTLRNKRQGCPLLIDADGLNLLSRNPSLMKYAEGAVVTPHFLEMSRLSGISVEDISNNTVGVAFDFAKKHSLVCLLKDSETIISDGGEEIYINKRGNSGMATAGSGDVLSGVISGILAQAARRNEKEALAVYAALGAYIHSVAGDIAAARLGEYSLMASDIIDALPEAISK